MKLIDTNTFPLQGTQGRCLHLATIHHGIREFMHYVDLLERKFYLEEITGGTIQTIKDNSLFEELDNFLKEHGINSGEMILFLEEKRQQFGYT